MAARMGVLRILTRNALEIPLRRNLKRCLRRQNLRNLRAQVVQPSCFALHHGSRSMSTLPAPSSDESDKQYPEHIKKIVDDISKLTILEVADLNQLLKVTLNIQDAPMMPMGAMAAAPAQDAAPEETEKEAEPTEFTVKLTAFDAAAKVKLIKEIKLQVPGMNLVQAKKFVEGLPQVVREKTNKDEAEQVKKALEAAGGTVEIET